MLITPRALIYKKHQFWEGRGVVFKRQLLSDTRFELLEWACAEVGRGASTPLTKHVCNVKLDRVREVLDDLLPQGDVSGIAD